MQYQVNRSYLSQNTSLSPHTTVHTTPNHHNTMTNTKTDSPELGIMQASFFSFVSEEIFSRIEFILKNVTICVEKKNNQASFPACNSRQITQDSPRDTPPSTQHATPHSSFHTPQHTEHIYTPPYHTQMPPPHNRQRDTDRHRPLHFVAKLSLKQVCGSTRDLSSQ